MHDYKVETRVSIDGSLTVSDVPFPPGDRVEVIIRSRNQDQSKRYALRGTPIKYSDPFGSVAEEEWEALR